jgi:hypothetical protein
MNLEGVSHHLISPLEAGDYLLAQKLLEDGGVDLTAGRGEFGWLSDAVSFITVCLCAAFQNLLKHLMRQQSLTENSLSYLSL